MPLQWLPLQQRQRQQPFSPYAEALTPQRTGDRGGMTAEQKYAPGFVEREKARWAEEDKLRKAERDRKMQEAQEIGMRIRAGHERELQSAQKQAAMIKAEREKAAQVSTQTLTKEDVSGAAMELWKFISTLDPESQKFYIKTLKEKELGKGGYIEAGGKRVPVPGSLGMYSHMVEKGLIDPATDTVIKTVGEQEWYYDAEDNLMYNRKTGKSKKIETGEVDSEFVANAFNYGSTYMGRLTEPTLLEKINPENMKVYLENCIEISRKATENYLISVGNLSQKEAQRIANSIPLEETIKTEKTIPPSETTPTPEQKKEKPQTGKNAPLDVETAKGMVEYLNENPGATIDNDTYRNQYGDATVDFALKLYTKPEGKEKPKKTFLGEMKKRSVLGQIK